MRRINTESIKIRNQKETKNRRKKKTAERKTVRRKAGKRFGRWYRAACLAVTMVSLLPVTALAAESEGKSPAGGGGAATGGGTTAITQPLDNLKTLDTAIIGAVGLIILAKNVMEFAQAYQQQDSSTMNSALKGIVAGVMMAGISTVMTFLGF